MIRKSLYIVLLALLVLGLAGCYGPSPEVVSRKLQSPQAKGSPYILAVTIRNKGGGQGQVDVQSELRSRKTSRTVASKDQQVMLGPHETVQMEIQLNPIASGPYKPIVSVQYPP